MSAVPVDAGMHDVLLPTPLSDPYLSENFGRLQKPSKRRSDGPDTFSWEAFLTFLSGWVLGWRHSYKSSFVKGDIVAGFTIGVLLIPQGMAYGLLAGLPAYYGLYAALVPALVYAFLGASPPLHIGPFALVSLLVADGINEVVDDDSDVQGAIDAAVTMSMIIGVMLLLMGLLRLGFMVTFLADSVLRGFTTGAATLIAASQMKHLFGLGKYVERGSFINTVRKCIEHMEHINWTAFFIAVLSVAFLLLCKWLDKKVKAHVAKLTRTPPTNAHTQSDSGAVDDEIRSLPLRGSGQMNLQHRAVFGQTGEDTENSDPHSSDSNHSQSMHDVATFSHGGGGEQISGISLAGVGEEESSLAGEDRSPPPHPPSPPPSSQKEWMSEARRPFLSGAESDAKQGDHVLDVNDTSDQPPSPPNRKPWYAGVPIPGELLAVVITTAVVRLGNLHDKYDVDILGDVPEGLPHPRFPPMTHFADLVSSSVATGLVAFIVTMSIVKFFEAEGAAKGTDDAQNTDGGAGGEGAVVSKKAISANQELMTLGIANILGSMFASYPASGSLSRSAVVDGTGGNSPMHNFVSVTTVGIVLLSMTSLLWPMPKAVLAAIILVALRRLLLQFSGLPALWRVSKEETLAWVATYLTTVLLGSTVGVISAMGFSIALLLKSTSRPSYDVLARLPGTSLYRSSRHFEKTDPVDGVLVFRFDAGLHFANREFFKTRLEQAIRHRTADEAARREAPLVVSAGADTANDSAFGVPAPSTGDSKRIGINSGEGSRGPHVVSHAVEDLGSAQPAAQEDREIGVSYRTDRQLACTYFHCLQCGQRVWSHQQPPLFAVVIDASAINYLDTSAMATVQRFLGELRSQKLTVYFAGLKPNVRAMMARGGFMQVCSADRMFASIHGAVTHAVRTHESNVKRQLSVHGITCQCGNFKGQKRS